MNYDDYESQYVCPKCNQSTMDLCAGTPYNYFECWNCGYMENQ